MKNFVQNGKVITYTVPADTTIDSGDVVIIGGLKGVAQTGGTTGDAITVQLYGVFNLPKTGGQAITQGALVYWNAGAGLVTTVSTDNTLLGHAFLGAASGDTTVDVRLDN